MKIKLCPDPMSCDRRSCPTGCSGAPQPHHPLVPHILRPSIYLPSRDQKEAFLYPPPGFARVLQCCCGPCQRKQEAARGTLGQDCREKPQPRTHPTASASPWDGCEHCKTEPSPCPCHRVGLGSDTSSKTLPHRRGTLGHLQVPGSELIFFFFILLPNLVLGQN